MYNSWQISCAKSYFRLVRENRGLLNCCSDSQDSQLEILEHLLLSDATKLAHFARQPVGLKKKEYTDIVGLMKTKQTGTWERQIAHPTLSARKTTKEQAWKQFTI